MGPRLFSRGNVLEGIMQELTGTALQWGHDFSAVEIVWHGRRRRRRRRASMGPRLFSRGNHASDYYTEAASDLLQWGHDFSAVEMNWRELRGRSGFSFNGATTFQPWKLRNRNREARNKRSASMGPRLFSRGNYSCSWKSYTLINASMGPRLFSRGNPVRVQVPTC